MKPASMNPAAAEEKARFDLPPELSALEASLGALAPRENADSRERTKSAVLLASCRLAEELTPPLSREKLIETIVSSGQQEITLSLREYLKSERLTASLYGALGGLLLGLLLGAGGGLLLSRLAAPPIPPVREVHYVRGIDFSHSIPTDVFLPEKQ